MHWVSSSPGNVHTRDVFTKIIITVGAWGGDSEEKLWHVIDKESYQQKQGDDDVWYSTIIVSGLALPILKY